MTFSEFRKSFISYEDFMLAFGQLSNEEAHALINAEEASPSIKACMITAWQKARKN